MKVTKIFIGAILATLCFTSCSQENNQKSELMDKDTTTTNKSVPLKSHIAIFEIPANDISRAIRFYQAILDIKIEKMEMPGMEMGILPYENQAVIGVLLKAKGYKPSSDGVTIYLNGGENLQLILDKVEKNYGKVMIPKTKHADDSGYFAIFIDSEGNRMGLHSVN